MKMTSESATLAHARLKLDGKGFSCAHEFEANVRATISQITLPTYLPAPPDRNPMFLEKRVYQGSNGKVYPLPFPDRIAEKSVDREWQAVWIEKEFLKVLVLPELGGRIHAIQDRTNSYDLIYNQPVIKPALVGLAEPWISGGTEFNWPQHHQSATFLPVAFQIEEYDDSPKNVWCGNHDPMCRMKGMHGVCVHPGRIRPRFFKAHAELGLDRNAAAKRLLQQVLRRDSNDALAADLNYEIAKNI